jgi:lipopolysaccharide export system protein LptA
MKAAVGILLAALFVFLQSCAAPETIKKTDAAVNLKPAAFAGSVTKTAAGASPVADKTPAPAAPARKDKFRIKQLIINSDTMNYNKETSEAVFHGHVEAEASNVMIKADQLTSKDYRKSAQAVGHVSAFYKDQGVTIDCGRLDYKDKLSLVYAYDDVTAHKTLANGDTVVLKAEELSFNAADNVLTAKKVKKRIRITMKDIIAFSDEVRYNDATREMLLTGFPLVKKAKSIMLAESIMMNVDKKSMKLTQNIWTKLFYKDFETAQKEVKVETDKNGASGKDVQQKAGSK